MSSGELGIGLFVVDVDVDVRVIFVVCFDWFSDDHNGKDCNDDGVDDVDDDEMVQ